MNRNIITVTIVLLSGCAVTSSPPPPVETVRYVQVRAPSTVDKLMFYVDKVQSMTPAQRAEERQRLKRALMSGGDDKVRLRYALLLIWSSSQEGLEAQRRLLRAVDPAAFGDDALQVKALVATLLRVLKEGPERVERRWRTRLQRREGRIEALQAENRRLQGRIDELQAQIDALKAIERSIQQRMSP